MNNKMKFQKILNLQTMKYKLIILKIHRTNIKSKIQNTLSKQEIKICFIMEIQLLLRLKLIINQMKKLINNIKPIIKNSLSKRTKYESYQLTNKIKK